MKKDITLLVISITSPILVGIYDQEDNLVEIISKEGKTSDILPLIFEELEAKYTLKELLYVNGPGSYMAIKISYIFLKTYSIIKNITLKGAVGFEFNGNSPIKALGKKYFFNGKDGNISIDFLKKTDTIEDFILPKRLNKNIFSKDCLPNYNLPAVN